MRHPPTHLTVLAFLAAGSLCGCWPPRPEQIEILVSTAPPGASCVLSEGGPPVAAIGPTPAIALLPPSGGPLTVLCRRPGFADVAVTVPAAAMSSGDEHQRRVDIALVPSVMPVPPPP